MLKKVLMMVKNLNLILNYIVIRNLKKQKFKLNMKKLHLLYLMLQYTLKHVTKVHLKNFITKGVKLDLLHIHLILQIQMVNSLLKQKDIQMNLFHSDGNYLKNILRITIITMCYLCQEIKSKQMRLLNLSNNYRLGERSCTSLGTLPFPFLLIN